MRLAIVISVRSGQPALRAQNSRAYVRGVTKISPPANLEAHALRDEPELVLLAFDTPEAPKLTPVECEIAIAVARGLSNAEIAKQRDVATRTIANQIASLFTKLGVSSRAELAAKLSVEHLR